MYQIYVHAKYNKLQLYLLSDCLIIHKCRTTQLILKGFVPIVNIILDAINLQ